MNENKNNAGTTVAVAREAYEAKVGIEAVSRAGHTPRLKGIVHEVLVKDSVNCNPANILSGTKATLAKSSTAVRDDILIKQGGDIIKRMQLKDTPNSIAKTVQQVSNGKYVGTNLVGTKETAQAYQAAVERSASKCVSVTQKMTSSGVSSSDTARIATKTLGNSAGSLTVSSAAKVAGSSGVVGGAISGGIELVSSGIKLANGEIDGEKFVGNVAKETVGGGLAAAGGSAAATAVAAGTATLLAATAAPVWIPAAVGIGVAVAIGSCIKDLWDCLWDNEDEDW
jgi:hypothetical protein